MNSCLIRSIQRQCEHWEVIMRNEFTAIFEQDGDWTIAYCPEIPGANGQGRTREAARQNLVDAISLILEDRREDMMRGLPADADKDKIGRASCRERVEMTVVSWE